MKQVFIEKDFREPSLEIIQTAEAICREYGAQGYDLSLRQLYYQFVARGLIANTERQYKRLGGIISDARLAGLIDWKYIKDRGRKEEKNQHWADPSEILDVCAQQFRIDTWADQPNNIWVMVEKQALQGVLEPVCKRLDVPFIANKGYSSSSSMYEVGRELHKKHSQDGRNPIVIYLGDHDPSGVDMTRDIEERLGMFAETGVAVHRVALNIGQVEEFKPPENPAKVTDSRAAGYIAKYGRSSWELDALEPSLLASLVSERVLSLRDEVKHESKVGLQNAWREDLAGLAEQYRAGER